ncbi:MAG: hypothetical protein N0E54_02830, partial [Candidatus Thiodiazotropha taylori]|nr:hypothetical protein [Candidatus Thiodiazotropha endolucinida]MCW4227660.1 hypothetical protein [Candidatus Thiodiazotropha taylori]
SDSVAGLVRVPITEGTLSLKYPSIFTHVSLMLITYVQLTVEALGGKSRKAFDRPVRAICDNLFIFI